MIPTTAGEHSGALGGVGIEVRGAGAMNYGGGESFEHKQGKGEKEGLGLGFIGGQLLR